MKFASYKINGKTTYGSVVENEKGVQLTDIGAIEGKHLKQWIEEDGLDKLKEHRSEWYLLKEGYLDHPLSKEPRVQIGEMY